ncbi:MAG: Fic family protein [Planctomycetia bacterium]|nr:Fic family protein [Planctomycetia bacterium]
MDLMEYNSGRWMKQNPGTVSEYKSFLPEMINHDWSFSDTKINKLLEKGNLALGRLESYAELIPDIDVYIKMHLRTEANKSNKIEGTQTTIEEDLLPLEDVLPEKRNDHKEINNYIRAINFGVNEVLSFEGGLPLCNRLLKQIHGVLMEGVRGEYKTPGEFRTSQNWIGGSCISDAVYVPPSIDYLPNLMTDIEMFMNNEDIVIPHLIRIALLHYQFETVHPFLDGNGRIGRLMIPLYLLSKNILSKPCFYISDYFEKHRTEYYNKLQNARTNNDMTEWIRFFLEASIVTAETAMEKFKKVVSFVDETKRMVISLPKKNTQNIYLVVEAFYSQPILGASQLVKQTNLSAPSINSILNELVNRNIIVESTGYSRNKIYTMKRYIELFR